MEENKKFQQMEPTKIVYKPHCGNCGFPIDNDIYGIAYRDIYEKPTEVSLTKKIYTQVYPNKCAHCGASFVFIEISLPKQLNDIFLGK